MEAFNVTKMVFYRGEVGWFQWRFSRGFHGGRRVVARIFFFMREGIRSFCPLMGLWRWCVFVKEGGEWGQAWDTRESGVRIKSVGTKSGEKGKVE